MSWRGASRLRDAAPSRRPRGVKTLLAPFLLASTTLAQTHDVSTQLGAIRGKHTIPALGAAAVREGEVVALGVSGVRQFGAADAVKTTDLWHIGSCTKSMTATLAGVLVDEGKARWDMTIADALPALKTKLHADWRSVTLEQLLTNRAGAPNKAWPDLWMAAMSLPGTPREQRLWFAEGHVTRKTEAPAGTKFIYSNQGFAIAGAMLEQLAGRSYEELLREKVLAPLGIKSAGFGPPGEGQPRGHFGEGRELKPAPVDADNPPAITPAGRVHLTLADFARYASWHARGPLRDVKLMSDATFQRLHTAPAGQDYAMGWGVAERAWAGGTTLTHNGSNTMWFAVMWVAPAKYAAYVAVANSAGKAATLACDEAVASLIQR